MILPDKNKRVKHAVSIGISAMLLFSSTAMAASPVLKVGSRGEEVTAVQLKLKDLKFFNTNATGYYGSITRDAVIRFQGSKGLVADGIVGAKTYAALGILGDNGSGAPAPKPDDSAKPNPPSRGDAGQASDKITRLLMVGTRGADVSFLQETLKTLGYYKMSVDGIFGSGTRTAVINFQKATGLVADGIVGKNTVAKLDAPKVVNPPSRGEGTNPPAEKPPAEDPTPSQPPQDNKPGQPPSSGEQPNTGIEALEWSVVDGLFPRKTTARVIDVDTRKSFTVYRYGGVLHADLEPLTQSDTAIMKQIYGGSWSWARRAVILEVAGRRIAASINGMPHGGQDLKTNDFDGQFCMHFIGSRTHASNNVDPDHQAMIQKAAASK